MNQLLNYLALCWFRNNPAQLSPTAGFMRGVILYYLVSGIIIESLIADPADGTLEVLLRTLMAFSSISLFLISIRKWSFFNQIFTAIFVCENFIITLGIGVEILDYIMVRFQWLYREEISIGLGSILVIWYIAIISYIIRQFFSYKTFRSIYMAFSYFIVTYGLPMGFMDL